jgi:hypothetical protein
VQEEPERIIVRSGTAVSDAVLRAALAHGGVHVVSVHGSGRGAAVTALVRYQTGLLLRSHRWVAPLAVYAVFGWFAGASAPLGSALGWTAAALVPVVAWLARLMLTAEPPEARACIAAAAGPRRAQLAALITVFSGGLVIGLAGMAYDLAGDRPLGGPAGYARTVAVGLVAMVVCVSIGSAIGALCNPPVVRAVAGALLGTAGVVIVALVSSVSPANAAIRAADAQPHSSAWSATTPLIAAVGLLALSWTVSAVLAARRGA